MKTILLLLSFTLITIAQSAGQTPADSLNVVDTFTTPPDTISGDTSIVHTRENKRLVAIALAIALGPFGGHRIYLGSHFMVPIAYVLTLGGGLGIIPAIDIIAMLLTRDMTNYANNNKFFMWTKKLESLDRH